MLLSVIDIREAIETDLPDEVLTRYASAAEEAITNRVGDPTSRTERFEREVYGGRYHDYSLFHYYFDRRGGHLFLGRPAATITTVTEFDTAGNGTVIAADQYELRLGGRVLARKGHSIRWGYDVEVIYAPVSDLESRKQVQLELVRLAITYRGTIKSETTSGYAASAAMDPAAYRQEREQIMRALDRGAGVVC